MCFFMQKDAKILISIICLTLFLMQTTFYVSYAYTHLYALYNKKDPFVYLLQLIDYFSSPPLNKKANYSQTHLSYLMQN